MVILNKELDAKKVNEFEITLSETKLIDTSKNDPETYFNFNVKNKKTPISFMCHQPIANMQLKDILVKDSTWHMQVFVEAHAFNNEKYHIILRPTYDTKLDFQYVPALLFNNVELFINVGKQYRHLETDDIKTIKSTPLAIENEFKIHVKNRIPDHLNE